MDSGEIPERRIIAVAEINCAMAVMKLIQLDERCSKLIDRLYYRMPECFMHNAGNDRIIDGGLQQLDQILRHFKNAARDYGVENVSILCDLLDSWREPVEQLLNELALDKYALVGITRSNLVMSAYLGIHGELPENAFFAIPGVYSTDVVAPSGSIAQRLPAGMLNSNTASALHSAQLKPKQINKLNMKAYIRECVSAAVKRLPVMQPGEYTLIVCNSIPECDAIAGTYTRKQLEKLFSDTLQELRRHNSNCGYLTSGSESFEMWRQRALANQLLLTLGIQKHIGAVGVRIVNIDAMDALSDLAHSDVDAIGLNAELAIKLARHFARTSGCDYDAIDTTVRLVIMLLEAMNAHFVDADYERMKLYAGILSALICIDEPDVRYLNDIVDKLYGISAQDNVRIKRIIEAIIGGDNDEIYGRLTPDAIQPIVEPNDGGQIFESESADADEFTEADITIESEDTADVDFDAADDIGELYFDAESAAADIAPDEDALVAFAETEAVTEAEPAQAAVIDNSMDRHDIELRMCAIILLAHSMTISGKNHYHQFSIKRNNRSITVRAVISQKSLNSIALEPIEFRYRAELFEKVFGIKARLKLVTREV